MNQCYTFIAEDSLKKEPASQPNNTAVPPGLPEVYNRD